MAFGASVGGGDADHNVKYNVKADFTSLITAVRKAREELKALQKEEALASKQSIDNAKKVDEARAKNIKGIKDEREALKETNAEIARGTKAREDNRKSIVAWNTEVGKSLQAMREQRKERDADRQSMQSWGDQLDRHVSSLQTASRAREEDRRSLRGWQSDLASSSIMLQDHTRDRDKDVDSMRNWSAALGNSQGALRGHSDALQAHSAATRDNTAATSTDSAANERSGQSLSTLGSALTDAARNASQLAEARRNDAAAADQESNSTRSHGAALTDAQAAQERFSDRLVVMGAARRQDADAADRDTKANRDNTDSHTSGISAVERHSRVVSDLADAHDRDSRVVNASHDSYNRWANAVGSANNAGEHHSEVVRRIGEEHERTEGKVRKAVEAIKDFFRNLSAGGKSGDDDTFGKLGASVDKFGDAITKVIGNVAKFGIGLGSLLSAAEPLVAALGSLGAAAAGLGTSLISLSGYAAALPGLFGAAASSMAALAIGIAPVKKAFTEYSKLQDQIKEGGTGAAEAQKKLDAALKDLSPSAQEVVKQMFSMKDSFKEIQQRTQEGLFGPVAGEMDRVRSLLPIVSDGFASTANAIGQVAAKGIEMISSGPWKADFQELMKSNVQIIGTMGDALLSVLDGFRNIAVAAIPFTKLVTEDIKTGAANFADFMRQARDTGQLADWLEKVHERGTKVFQIVKDLAAAMLDFGKSVSPLGDWLLDAFEKGAGALRNFASEQNKAGSEFRTTFEAFKPLLTEIGSLIGDVAKAVGNMMSDRQNIETATTLFNQLRVEVLPALVKLFNELRDSGLAESTVSTLAKLLNDIADLAGDAAGVLSTFVHSFGIFADLLLKIANIPIVGDIITGLGTALATLAAAVTVAKLSGLTHLVELLPKLAKGAQEAGQTISSAFADTSTKIDGLTRVTKGLEQPVTAATTNISGLGAAAQKSHPSVNELATSVGSRLTNGLEAGKGALSGLTAALGGPWGIAIAAATVAIGLFIQKLQEQQQETAKHEANINSLKTSLGGLKGAYEELQAGNAKALIDFTGSNDQLKEMVKHLNEAGVSTKTLTDAVNGNDQALSEVNGAYDTLIASAEHKLEVDQQGISVLDQMKHTYGSVTGTLDVAKDAWNAVTGAQTESTHASNAQVEADKRYIEALKAENGAVIEAAENHKRVIEAYQNAVLASDQLTVSQRGMLESSKQLGPEFEHLTQLMFTLNDANATSAAKSQAFKAAIEEVGNSAVPSGNKLEALSHLSALVGDSSLTAADKAKTFKDILKEIGETAGNDEAKHQALAKVFSDIANAELDAATKAGLLRDAWDQLHQPALDAVDATDKLGKTTTELNQSLPQMAGNLAHTAGETKEHSDSVEKNTGALKNNLEALKEKLIQDVANLSQDDLKNGKAKELTDTYNGQVDQILGKLVPANEEERVKIEQLRAAFAATSVDAKTPAELKVEADTAEANKALNTIRAGQLLMLHPDWSNGQAMDAAGAMNAAAEFKQLAPKKDGGYIEPERFSYGGSVQGPGGPRDDVIPAMLSAGEYVQNAKAVSFYGRDRMEAVNNMTAPMFSTGGYVGLGVAPQRLATGGFVGPKQGFAGGGGLQSDPININITATVDNAIGALDKLKADISSTVNDINGQMAGMWDHLKEMARNSWAEMWNQVGQAGSQLGPMINDIKHQMGEMWDNLKEMARNSWNEMWNQVGQGGSQLGPMISDIKRQMAEMWDNLKEMARNSWAEMWNQVGNGGSQLGPMINDIKAQMAGMWDSLKEMARASWGEMWSQIGQVGNALEPTLNDVRAQMARLWDSLKEMARASWGEMWAQVGQVGNALEPTLNDVRAQMARLWDSLKEMARNSWGEMWSQVGQVGNALEPTLNDVRAQMARMWDTLKEMARNSWAEMWNQIATTGSGAIQPALDDLYNRFVGAWNAVTAVSQQLYGQLWQSLAGAGSSAIQPALDDLYNRFVGAWNAVTAVSQQLYGQLWQSLAGQGSSAIQPALDDLYNRFVGAWNAVTAVSQQLYAQLWQSLAGQGSSAIQPALDDLYNRFVGAWNAVTAVSLQLYAQLWQQVASQGSGALQPALDDMYNRFVTAWNNVIAVSVQLWNELWQTVSGAGTGALQGALDKVYEAFVKMWHDINTVSLQLWNELWTTISGAGTGKLQESLDKVYDAFVKMWHDIQKVSEQLWSEMWDQLLLAFRNFTSTMENEQVKWANEFFSSNEKLTKDTFRDWTEFLDNKLKAFKNHSDEIDSTQLKLANAYVSSNEKMHTDVGKSWTDHLDKMLAAWNNYAGTQVPAMEKYRDTVIAIWGAITEGVLKEWNKVLPAVVDSWSKVVSWINTNIIEKINSILGSKIPTLSGPGAAPAATTAAPAASAAGAAVSGAASGIAAALGIQPRAQGGFIQGPGTETSDDIPARLSAGEYVLRAGAVRKIGVETLDKMNWIDKRPARFTGDTFVDVNHNHMDSPGPNVRFAKAKARQQIRPVIYYADGGGVGGALGAAIGAAQQAVGYRNTQNNGLMEEHRNHVHVAMSVPPSQDTKENPAITAAMRGANVPLNPGSGFRAGSTGSGGGADHHSEGIATDFMGFEQDALAAFAEGTPGVIELIHRTNKRDYAIFGGSGAAAMFQSKWGAILRAKIDEALKVLDTMKEGVKPLFPKIPIIDPIFGVAVDAIDKEIRDELNKGKAAAAAGGASGPLSTAQGSPAQVGYAQALLMGANPKMLLSLFETGIVESGWRNDASVSGADHDSIGILQQRPSQGWGTPDQLNSPAYQVQQFLSRWQDVGTPGQSAQAVQRSGFPDKYDQVEAQARQMLHDLGAPGFAKGGIVKRRQMPDFSNFGPDSGRSIPQFSSGIQARQLNQAAKQVQNNSTNNTTYGDGLSVDNITINNPIREPAGESLYRTIKKVTSFGGRR